jgi:hypothetical protein
MNPTLFVNIGSAILGLLAAFGFKLDISADLLGQLAGGLVAAVAVVNQVVHFIRDRSPS